jgi:hypothetical protein
MALMSLYEPKTHGDERPGQSVLVGAAAAEEPLLGTQLNP